jgi:crotonobetainyl-CoA:carnitine CoA-transferase CaiB-like acyl-CoA transferase
MPLSGLKIVDLTRILAGPIATMMLGDMGADVIKVERPGSGDDSRGWGPPFVDGTSTYFLSINRNKRGITLDLKTAVGRDLLWELIEGADVVVSNFRVGLMDEFGFSFERVAHRAPRCVYGLINGYGATGKRVAKPSFDVVIQAESGLMDLTGFPDGSPTKVGISIADQIAGLYLVQGVLLALLERQRTDRGQLVEVALHDAMLSMFTFQAQAYLSAGVVPHRCGNRHPSITPYETFEAADGMLVVGVANERQWSRLCDVMGVGALVDDKRFATNADRVVHRDELKAELAPRFGVASVAEWETRLGAGGVPCGRVRALDEVIESERSADRDMVVRVDGMETLGVPIKLSRSPGSARLRAPDLGEHTEAILSELGHTEEEVAAWRAAGII